MGIFDIFKKKDVVQERIVVKSFSEAQKIFLEKSEDFKKSEKGILIEIKGIFEDFYVSIKEKLEILEAYDVESKKEDGRVLLLVRQGLDKYVGSVHILLKDLGSLEKDDLRTFADEFSRVFTLFEKKSSRFYQRATYLIGEEMLNVRNETRKLYNTLLKVFEERKRLIGDLKRLEEASLRMSEIEGLEDTLKDLKGKILEGEEETRKNKGEIETSKKDIETIKKSSEYISHVAKKEKIVELENELGRAIGILKGLIDFKKLVGIVHSNEREMRIVKSYRDHFALEFSRDSKKLLALLEESQMKNSSIEDQVLLIEKLKDEIIEVKKRVGTDLSVGTLKEIDRLKEKIVEAQEKSNKTQQRVKEVVLRLETLKDEVVGLVEVFGR